MILQLIERERIMSAIFKTIHTALETGEDIVLLTVVSAEGSIPRGAGARMVVHRNGSFEGTIGGGSVEYISIQMAMELFETQQSYVHPFGLEQKGNAGMVCGGNIRVLFQYIPNDTLHKELYQRIWSSIQERKDTWLAINVTESFESCVYVGDEIPTNFRKEKPTIVKEDDRDFYIEMVASTTAVYIFGGGHVGQEVVPVLSHLGFYTAVVDSRETLANPSYFPTADEIHCIPYSAIGEHIVISPRDYVIIMTNGHQYDLDILEAVLPKKPFYIGVMGSRHKVEFVTEKLSAKGFTKQQIESCHMPIGLDIAAETPAEIAISIAAEIIQHRSIRSRKG